MFGRESLAARDVGRRAGDLGLQQARAVHGGLPVLWTVLSVWRADTMVPMQLGTTEQADAHQPGQIQRPSP